MAWRARVTLKLSPSNRSGLETSENRALQLLPFASPSNRSGLETSALTIRSNSSRSSPSNRSGLETLLKLENGLAGARLPPTVVD